jgi:hypothetical protein
MRNEIFFCDDCIIDGMCVEACREFISYCEKRLLGIYSVPEMFVNTHTRYVRSINTCESELHNSFQSDLVTSARSEFNRKVRREKIIKKICKSAEKLNF